MYRTDNEKIGRHLNDLIQNKYPSDRQFCMAYIACRDDRSVDSDDPDIQRMQNRICQIKKGKKGVQIEDLPIFSQLLGVSVDNILSGGTCLVPASERETNYSLAFSQKPQEWEAYIQREDKPFLNPDEFNKTLIDYALEAKNYDLMKYLMDKNYIWFVGEQKEEYGLGFGAGTSVKRREIGYTDVLDVRLKEQDGLRIKMIALAVENRDFSMLDRLHARELPLLYRTGVSSLFSVEKSLPFSDSIDRMIDAIARSGDQVLDYFFREFDVELAGSREKYTYLFPYAGQVLDRLIRNGKVNESRRFLGKVIDHNKKTKRQIQELAERSTEDCLKYYGIVLSQEDIWSEFYFYPQTGIAALRTAHFIPHFLGFASNVIRVTAHSKIPDIQALIDEVNTGYVWFVQRSEKERAKSHV